MCSQIVNGLQQALFIYFIFDFGVKYDLGLFLKFSLWN